MPRLAAGEKSKRELLREGDRGRCRPSGLISPFEGVLDASPCPTDGDCHGCQRPRSIGERRIDRKKISVCTAITSTLPKANRGEPAAFSVKGNDSAARIINPPALSMREIRTCSEPQA